MQNPTNGAATDNLPIGPKVWPPTTAWPAALHTGVAAFKAVLHQWQITRQNPQPVLLGVSGGADSLALAVIAAQTQQLTGARFGALIFDHQLQTITGDVARHTAAVCTKLGLAPVVSKNLTVTASGEGLEAAARQARYNAFVHCVHDTGATGVLTAHTANDQAEQVLLGLARGSGMRSLAGIRRQRFHKTPGYAPIRIFRPLLDLTRQDTETICQWAGISYFQDPMNADESLARIRVRKNLLPALTDSVTGLGPGVFSGLVATAALAADDAAALDAWATDTFERLVVTEPQQLSFPLKALQELPTAVLRRVVALAVQHFGAPQPSFERLLAVQELVFPPVGRASSAGPIQLEGHVSLYRRKAGQEYAKLLVIPSDPRG